MTFWTLLAIMAGIVIGLILSAIKQRHCKKCKVNTQNLQASKAAMDELELKLAAKIAECTKEAGARKAAEAQLKQRMDNIAELGRLRREDEAKLKAAQDGNTASNRIKALAAQWQRIKPYLKRHARDAANNAIREYNKDVDSFNKNPKLVRRWIGNETVPTKISVFRK